MTTASIIVLTYNNLDLTRQCLESICAKDAGADFELVVVDNASTDRTQDYLREFSSEHTGVRLILNEENTGFARGNNLGAAVAAGDYIVFLNNDTVVTRGWLSGLISHLQDPSVGMVGPVTNSSGNETRIRVGYGRLDEMDIFAGSYRAAHAGESFEIGMLAFMCVALRRTVWNEIGSLEERFGLGMFEDDDYALRLKENGCRLVCAEDVFIHHWGSASFSKLDDLARQQLFDRNRRVFEQKWNREWHPHCYRPGLLHEPMYREHEPVPEAEIHTKLARLQQALTEREDQLYRLRAELGEMQQRLRDRQEATRRESGNPHPAWQLFRRIGNLVGRRS